MPILFGARKLARESNISGLDKKMLLGVTSEHVAFTAT